MLDCAPRDTPLAPRSRSSPWHVRRVVRLPESQDRDIPKTESNPAPSPSSPLGLRPSTIEHREVQDTRGFGAPPQSFAAPPKRISRRKRLLRRCSDPPRPQRISIDRDRFRRLVPVDEKPASGWTRRADRFPGKRLTRRFRPKPMRRPSTASLPSGEGCDPRNGHRTDGRTRRSKPNEEQTLDGYPPG